MVVVCFAVLGGVEMDVGGERVAIIEEIESATWLKPCTQFAHSHPDPQDP